MIRRYRNVQLLFTLSLLLVANPFLQGTFVFAVIDLLLLATLLSAVVACADRRRHVVVGITLTIALQGAAWYRGFEDHPAVTVFYSVLALWFFGYVTAMVLRDVFRDSEAVSADTICGALAVYLLLGLGWAFGYSLLEVFYPGSIAGLAVEGYANDYQRYLGYSFVTLTTLGYGNAVPVNPQAEALAAGEAIVGQVYLTVLVARLVALNLLTARSSD